MPTDLNQYRRRPTKAVQGIVVPTAPRPQVGFEPEPVLSGGDPMRALRRQAMQSSPRQVTSRQQPQGIDRLLQRDQQRWTLEQEKLFLEKAKLLESASATRYKMENERQATLHAAALISKLGDLDVADPKFEQNWSAVIADHAPGFNTQIAQTIIKAKRADWGAHKKAHELRDLSSFAGPAQTAYTQALADSGDPAYANRVAQGQQQLFDRWKTAYTSPHLPENVRAQMRDDQGGYRYDSLDAAEIEIAKAEGARGAGKDDLQPLTALTKARDALAKYAEDKPDDATARESLDAVDKALIRSAKKLGNSPSVVGASTADLEARRFLGDFDGPQPAPPAQPPVPPTAVFTPVRGPSAQEVRDAETRVGSYRANKMEHLIPPGDLELLQRSPAAQPAAAPVVAPSTLPSTAADAPLSMEDADEE